MGDRFDPNPPKVIAGMNEFSQGGNGDYITGTEFDYTALVTGLPDDGSEFPDFISLGASTTGDPGSDSSDPLTSAGNDVVAAPSMLAADREGAAVIGGESIYGGQGTPASEPDAFDYSGVNNLPAVTIYGESPTVTLADYYRFDYITGIYAGAKGMHIALGVTAGAQKASYNWVQIISKYGNKPFVDGQNDGQPYHFPFYNSSDELPGITGIYTNQKGIGTYYDSVFQDGPGLQYDGTFNGEVTAVIVNPDGSISPFWTGTYNFTRSGNDVTFTAPNLNVTPSPYTQVIIYISNLINGILNP